jgi:hypothetical protein
MNWKNLLIFIVAIMVARPLIGFLPVGEFWEGYIYGLLVMALITLLPWDRETR